MPTILVKRAVTVGGALAVGEIGFKDADPWGLYVGTTVGNKQVGLDEDDRDKLAAIEASADVTDAGNVAAVIHGVAEKTTLYATDEFGIIDTQASNVLKKLLWSTIKAYMDGVAIGIDLKDPVRLATAAALPACTASGSEVGKKLTANGNGVLTVDGVATVLNDRILVKNQATEEDNGIYKVTTEGTAGAAFVLTRATDSDTDAEVTFGMLCAVITGTANGNQTWMLTTVDPVDLDTTELTFTQFSSVGGVSTFLALTDTPASYEVADALKIVRVNAAHNALEFTDTIDGGAWA